MESIFVTIIGSNNISIIIGCLYRAHNTDIVLFNNEMHSILENLKNSTVFICGDFNIDLLMYMILIRRVMIL